MPKKTIIIIISIIILLLIIFIPDYSRLQKLKGTNQDLTKKIEELTIENTQLSKEIQKLKEDPLYLEKVARKEMAVGRKGEVIYRITQEGPDE